MVVIKAAGEEDLLGEEFEGFSEGGDAEALDGSGAEDGRSVGGGSARGSSGQGKAKGDGQGRCKRQGQGGRPKAATTGMKKCNACNKNLPIDKFPLGSAHCANDRQPVQNIASAAKAQGKEAWWAEVMRDPKKLQKVVKAYHVQCPKVEGKKRAPFKVLAYIEYVRQEELLIKDEEYEMMDLRRWIAWHGKQKNGSMDPEEARALFFTTLEQPDTMSDELGPSEKYRTRIAKKVRDVIIKRDQELRGRGYDLKEKDVKKATTEDIDKAESRVQRGSVARGASAQTRNELAQAMVKAGTHCPSASALGSEAKAIAQFGNVMDLASDSGCEEMEEERGGEDAEDDVDGEASAQRTPKKRKGTEGDGQSSKKQRGDWLDHGKVMAAISTHQAWMRSTRKSLNDSMKVVMDAREMVTAEARGAVANELKLLDNRYLALRLVLGEEACDYVLFGFFTVARRTLGSQCPISAFCSESPAMVSVCLDVCSLAVLGPVMSLACGWGTNPLR